MAKRKAGYYLGSALALVLVCLLFGATPAAADSVVVAPGVTFTVDTTTFSVTEGNPFTITGSVSNTSGSNITVSPGSVTTSSLSGDSLDVFSINLGLATGCAIATTVVSSGSSCSFTLPFTTTPFPGETDQDSGVGQIFTSLQITGPASCAPLPFHQCIPQIIATVTVTDRAPAGVPEPASLPLLGSGLLALGASIRRIRS